MAKKFLIFSLVIIFCSILVSCKDTTPRIFLSTKPLLKETFVPMNEFQKNDTINFILISPKGFQSRSIRLQLIKKNNLSPIYGDTLTLGKDYNAENSYYLTGSFTVYSGGRYELRFYDSDGTKKKTIFSSKAYTPRPNPLAWIQFGVYD